MDIRSVKGKRMVNTMRIRIMNKWMRMRMRMRM